MTSLEIHALAKILDPGSSGAIEYCGFERGISNRILSSGDEDSDNERLMPDDYIPDIVTTPRGKKTDPLYASVPR